MNRLISIIVPVYKVEPFLARCIESICNQTYTNLEIILVDDGSPDACGRICDEYAQKDARIHVIHKQNGGQSDARNMGLDKAEGDYIGFVDGDDYIHPEMYETLLLNLVEQDADISIGYRKRVNLAQGEPCNDRVFPAGRNDTIVYSREEALIHLFTDMRYIRHAVWDKLYKKELFDGIRFPVGKLYEDMDVTYRLVDRASKIVFSKAQFYYYTRWAGCVTEKPFTPALIKDRSTGPQSAMLYFQQHEPGIANAASVWHLRVQSELWRSHFKETNGKGASLSAIKKEYDEVFSFSVIAGCNTFKHSFIFFLFRLNPRLENWLRDLCVLKSGEPDTVS